MRNLLLGLASLAALTVLASPALALDPHHQPFVGVPTASPSGANGVRIHRGAFGFGMRCDGGRDGRHDGRRGRDRCDGFVGNGVLAYDDAWALYNNRSWEPDSYNDWWHDQPWRSYPRWMARNRDCSRPWYAGDVLRC
jgi:hypothetical protein